MDVPTSLAQAIVLVLASGTAGVLINAFFNRRKTGAEAFGLKATAESTLSKATIEFAKFLQEDIENLRRALKSSDENARTLSRNLEEMRLNFEEAEKKSKQLQEVLAMHNQREAERKVLIEKLQEALRKYEPNNPLLTKLANL